MATANAPLRWVASGTIPGSHATAHVCVAENRSEGSAVAPGAARHGVQGPWNLFSVLREIYPSVNSVHVAPVPRTLRTRACLVCR